MYQKLLIAAMSITIGVCGGLRYGHTEFAPGCLGLLYPGLCYIEGTYQAPDRDDGFLLSEAEWMTFAPEQIEVRFKLLELLSE